MSKQIIKKTVHSKIGASSMHIWSECPASVKASEGVPETVSEFALEGTRAHDLAEKILSKKLTKDAAMMLDGLPEDMLDAVFAYVDFVETKARGIPKKHVFIEHKFDLSEIFPGLFGTADAVIYNEKEKLLSVIDYKHGAGIPVDAYKNPQLNYYGLGALLSLNLPCKYVELIVVQPRCERDGEFIRKYTQLAHELVEFAGDLKIYAEATTKEDAKFSAGEHCRFCKAAAVCPELSKNAIEVCKRDFSEVKQYATEEISRSLAMIPKIKQWIKAVEELAFNEARNGRVPPGYKLVAKRGTRKWHDALTAVEVFREAKIPEEQIFEEPSIKSVAQMEKVLKKHGKENLLAPLVAMVSSGETLVAEEDTRPEVLVDAKSQFTAIT